MTSVWNVRRELRKVIARFKFEELEQAVLPSFPEITWNNLRSSLIKHQESFTVPASISILEQVIQDAKIKDRDLKDRLSTLELMDISRHSTRKVWNCYELRGGDVPQVYHSNQEIADKISSSFSQNFNNTDVLVTTHDNITFVSVKDSKARRRRNTRVIPEFFAFYNGHKYLFTSRKNIDSDYFMAIVKGLGYNNSKLAKLSGRDLKSLIQLLRAKQQATINNGHILKPPVYTGTKPNVRSTGIDFTGAEQRKEYADKCFGNNPPTTQLLHLTFVNQTWKCTELVPEVENKVIEVKWEFHSRYIPNMIKQLVHRRVMGAPLPVYAENMLTIGRNEMTLRS